MELHGMLPCLISSVASAICLFMFYDKRFELARKNTTTIRANQIPRIMLWTLVVIHLRVVCIYPSSCALLCSIIQVPPFRQFFKSLHNKKAASARQILGPPFVLYVIKSAIEKKQKFASSASLAALAGFLAGCMIRPDNDWAGTGMVTGIIMSRSRRRIHAFLMAFSFILNLVGVVSEFCLVQNDKPVQLIVLKNFLLC